MVSEPQATNQPEGTAPDAVEMPRPTVAPFMVAFGLTLMAAAVALGLAFLAVGAVVLVAGLGIWIANFMPGRGHMQELLSEATQRTQPAPGVPGGVEHLQEGMPGYRLRLPQDVHPVSAGIKGGIVGGAVMPIPALLWGILSDNGFWFPVNLLAGMVVPSVGDMDASKLGSFHLSLLLTAIVIHVVLSLIIGLIYGVLLPTLPSIPRPIAWGGLLMPILWTGVSFVAMRVANPTLTGKVSWPWFIVSQFVFGITMPAMVLGVKRLHPVVAGVVGGLVGGTAMAVPALLWAAASGHGLWYPVNLLAGMVQSGPGAVEIAQLGRFHSEWLGVAGVMHAALSIVFGVLFALVSPRLPPIPAPIAWGGLILPMVWTGISYGLMGVVNPALQDHVSWPWFIVSQFVFGLVAAIVVLRSQMVHIPPAGRGPDRVADFVTGDGGVRS
jgi:hypothetical protein